MEPAPPTVVTVTSPADILGLLPYRLGFHPRESIVVLCLQGRRRRDTLVMRVDLRPPADDAAVARDVVERAAQVEASGVVIVCYTDAECDSDADADDPARDVSAAALARSALVDALRQGFTRTAIEVVDALLVRGDRWWSYCCSDSTCCPPTGSRLSAELTPAARHYAAESVGRGAAVLPDRADLARTIRPSSDAAEVGARERGTAAARGAFDGDIAHQGADGVRMLVLSMLRRLVERWTAGCRDLRPDDAAMILLGLRDKRARDEAATLVLECAPEALLAVLVALARHADDAVAAPICTVLAWVAYSEGDGALANVAIERALDCEPACELARLIEGGLEAMVPPDQLRRVTALVREDLRTGGSGQN